MELVLMPCPICGSIEYETIYRNGNNDFVGCDKCLEATDFNNENLWEECDGYEG